MPRDVWKMLDDCREAPGTKVVFSYEAISDLVESFGDPLAAVDRHQLAEIRRALAAEDEGGHAPSRVQALLDHRLEHEQRLAAATRALGELQSRFVSCDAPQPCRSAVTLLSALEEWKQRAADAEGKLRQRTLQLADERAVAQRLEQLLRRMLEACTRCEACDSIATMWALDEDAYFCDDHAPDDTPAMAVGELAEASAIRAALHYLKERA